MLRTALRVSNPQRRLTSFRPQPRLARPRKKIMKTLARLGAILSFLFCLLGGLWILTRVAFGSKDDVLSTAIGFYFVGKAFFVGPMLWLAGEKCGSK